MQQEELQMNKTENLKLNVWEKSDPIHAKDFNDNFQTLDSAVGSLQGEHIYVGSYVGDGKDSRTIDLPWEPKFAVIFGYIGTDFGISFATQTACRHIASACDESTANATKLKGAKFTIDIAGWNNNKGKVIHYILFR